MGRADVVERENHPWIVKSYSKRGNYTLLNSTSVRWTNIILRIWIMVGEVEDELAGYTEPSLAVY
jgi:hypothetical protein